MILQSLCNLLSPLGEYRQSHIAQSKGKRSKRQRGKKDKESGNNVAKYVPPMPEVARYITVGFNSTVCHLQHLAQPALPVTAAADAQEDSDLAKKVAAVFVCTSMLPELLTSFVPTLVAAASARCPSSSPIRLVSLTGEAERRLSEAIFQPRVGFVGVLQGVPGGKTLLDMTTDKTFPVDVPWLKSEAQVVEYRSIRIKTTMPGSKPRQRDPITAVCDCPRKPD